jgi:lysophospholipase L1-like esterase
MRMSGKSMLIFIGLVAACAGARGAGLENGAWGRRAGEGDSVTLRKLIVDYFDAVAAKNFVQLDSFTTKDFVIYEDGKVWNNDSVFHNIQFHQPFTVKFSLTDFHIFTDTRSGEARYHSHPEFVVMDSVHFSIDFIETATFRRTARGWKINMIHVTEEKPPVVVMPGYYRYYDTVRYIPEHYKERMEVFRGEAMSRGGIVLLGNSITEFGDWRQLFGDSGAVNRGIAGDNTFGMLQRLGDVIARRPRKLFVEAGINDIGQGVPVGMIAGNIASIVQYVRAKSPGTKVYVVSVLPTNDRAKHEYPEIGGKNDVVRELDGRLRGQAGSYGYVYIDLASQVTDGSGNLDERYAKEDGLHLNEAGYGVFVRLMKKGPVQ